MSIDRYLRKRADLAARLLEAGPLAGIAQVVVIPVLAEEDHLFRTLASLAGNDDNELRRTLVLCVVNNPAPDRTPAPWLEQNARTLAALRKLIGGGPVPAGAGAVHAAGKLSRLRIACVDASSPGHELPRDGGVGPARKAGMDHACAVLQGCPEARPLILSLDADTLVEPNYLAAVRRAFEEGLEWGALVDYAHREESGAAESAAIICYELYLRYHVLGMELAGSPYAFHAMGSIMVFEPGAYAAAGGMNRRRAGEDFYFLQQLVKTGRLGRIRSTVVRPSARVSDRVPFGTGPRVQRFLRGGHDEYRLRDPECYALLGRLLRAVSTAADAPADRVLDGVDRVAPAGRAFLETERFAEVWGRIQANAAGPEAVRARFHEWFDGLKTIRFLHLLERSGFEDMPMFEALDRLLTMAGFQGVGVPQAVMETDVPAQRAVLDRLRAL